MLEIPDQRYFDRSGVYIDAANGHLKDAAASRVSSSLMYAATRFHVWVGAASSQNLAEFEAKREEARAAFLKESERMFNRHYDDYTNNYLSYGLGGPDGRTPG